MTWIIFIEASIYFHMAVQLEIIPEGNKDDKLYFSSHNIHYATGGGGIRAKRVDTKPIAT